MPKKGKYIVDSYAYINIFTTPAAVEGRWRAEPNAVLARADGGPRALNHSKMGIKG